MKKTLPKKTTKQDLLAELESIKASLQDTHNREHESIPILKDLVVDDESCPDNIAQALEKISNSDYTHTTKPDNPFLPLHIREKLKQNRQDSALFYQSLMSNDAVTTPSIKPATSQEIIINEFVAKAMSSFIDNISNTTTNTFPLNIEDSTAANIDRLATLYLPIFETQLRQQLAKKIAAAKQSVQNAKTS